jgi:hypothetical protein
LPANYIAYWVPGSPGTWRTLNDGISQGTNGSVYCIDSGNGYVYVGGSFTQAGPYTVNNVARWNYTSVFWNELKCQSTIYNGVDAPVRSLWFGQSPQFSGSYGLVLGGDFINVASTTGINQAANHVAVWTPFNEYWFSLYSTTSFPTLVTTPGATGGIVYAVANDGNDKIYIAGDFTDVYDDSGNLNYPYIVEYTILTSNITGLNGTWNNALTSSSGPIFALDYYSGSGNLYAGGSFANIGGYAAKNTAYWDGTVWNVTPYLPAIGSGSGVNNGSVNSIKYNNAYGVIVNGGSFTLALEANSIINSSRVAYYDTSNYSWNPMKQRIIPYGVKNPSGPSIVYATIYDGISKIYVCGEFINAGGIYANNIAVYDTSNGTWYGLVDSTTNENGLNSLALSLCFFNSELYVGGTFTSAGGNTANHIAKWNYSTNTWSSVGTGSNNGTSGTVHAMATDNSSLFVGGNFTDAGTSTGVNNIATWDGSSVWAPLTDATYTGSGTDGPVYAITFGSSLASRIIIGGSFTTAGGGVTASNVVSWDYSVFKPLNTSGGEGTNGQVNALAVGGWGIGPTTNTVVYVGGNFTSVCNGTVNASYLAAYDFGTGPSWHIVGYGGLNTLNSAVRSLHYPGQNSSSFDTRLFIGGSFDLAGVVDYYQNHNILTPVNNILMFQEASSFASSYLNTLPNPSTTSSGGALYNGVIMNGVTQTATVNSVLFIGSNRLIVGGNFNECYSGNYNPTTPIVIARNVAIMTINSLWNNMSSPSVPALSGPVNAIVRVGSNIYVGGQFTNLLSNNQTLNYIAYWDTINYMWRSIVSGSAIGVDGTIETMELYSGSTILVGGSFTTCGATTVFGFGTFDTGSNVWTQPGSGLNSTVRDIYYKTGTTAYICGDFTADSGGTIPLYRVATVNLNTLQINQIQNSSGSHIGMNGSVYATLFISPRIYFGGVFTNTLPTSDLPMQNLSYFIVPTPLIINTTTAGFLDTEDGITYSQIVIPTRYKNVIIIYNSSTSPQALNKWLETYRSTGVTH